MVRREYLFFRHGEAQNQADGFPSDQIVRDEAGRADYPLSEKGRAHAASAGRVARAFGSEVVISSALIRARETAAIIAAETGTGEVAYADPDLDEVNPGRSAFSTMSFGERRHRIVSSALVASFFFDRRVSYRRTGESAEHLLARIDRALARLRERSESRIAVVTHGYWIFTTALLISPKAIRPRIVEHCSSTRVVEKDGQLRLVSFAEKT